MGERYDKLNTSLGRPSIKGGWIPLVEELLEKLDKQFPGWHCDQVKEKFGGLRFYAVPPKDLTKVQADTFYGLISETERASYNICEECGDPGESGSYGGYWMLTLCPEHAKERIEKRR